MAEKLGACAVSESEFILHKPEDPGAWPSASGQHKKDAARCLHTTTTTFTPPAHTHSPSKAPSPFLTATSVCNHHHFHAACVPATPTGAALLPLAAALGTRALSALPVIHVLTHFRQQIFCLHLLKMPSSSHLRIQSSFEPISAETTRSHYFASPPPKKQKMSLTQTYYIAASARSKLGKEACRADHDLRLLVGHANLLDSLMIELQDAERQQEAWFQSTVAKASRAEEPRHIQWADTIQEEPEEEDDSDSDSESDFYDEDGDLDMVMPRRIAQAPVQITTTEIDEDDEEDQYDDEEDDADLALTRVPSQSPPELVHDEDSDDESPPTSPPQPTMEFSEKEAMLTTSFYEKSQASYFENEIYEPTAPLITSY